MSALFVLALTVNRKDRHALQKAQKMEFIVLIIIIGVIGFIVFKKKSQAKRNRLKNKIEEIRKQYPLAYKEFITKNHISVTNAKISTLTTIVERPVYSWNEDEKRLRRAFEFDNWEKEQKWFTKRCRDLVGEMLPGFGCYSYEIPFRKTNKDGKSINGNYLVWQSFAVSYCLESDLDYANFENTKRNTNNLNEFKSRKRYFLPSVYEKIQKFIEKLCEEYSVSIYLCANNKEWNAESLNYHYQLYKGALFYNFPDDVEVCDPASDALIEETVIDYDQYPKLKYQSIVIVEMQTDNDHLKTVCKNIIEKNKDNNPLITYISFLKGYDRDEMLKLINEEKQKRKEEEERQKREREAEEKRKAESIRIAKEVEERNRLEALADSKKNNSQAFIDELRHNGISCLYHFTDESNLESIKEHGGLFSWSYCDEHGITIPMPGGGGLSRMLDKSRGLQDYVRLCFTKNHPMMYVAKKEGRINNPILLEIDLEVVTIDSTKFSNKNATIKRESVNIGNTLDDLKQIHFNTVKYNTHFDLADDEKSYFQAEVLVKTFVPIKYIKNINSPLYV